MLKQILSMIFLTAIISCTSAEKEKAGNKSDLSEKKAKDLIMKKMDTPEGNVGGTFTDVKEINIQSIEKNDNVYSIKFTWNGTITDPSTPPEEGEDMEHYNKKRHHQITNEKGELKLRQSNGNWQVIN